jgi:hypothetical protein
LALAAGPPSPDCIPDGNYCYVNYSASYAGAGATVSATWSVDVASHKIIGVYPSASPNIGFAICDGPSYAPSNPNTSPITGPVTVSYTDEIQSGGSANEVDLTLYNNGSHAGSSAGNKNPCI